MTKTAIRLSDGRELLYYDLPDAPPRTGVDRRGLGDAVTESEVRYDPILDQWVIMASHRQERTYKPAADNCPLCPSRPGHDTEVPAADYAVVVFENRFPALRFVGAEEHPAPVVDGSLVSRPGTGRCEVVCFTPDHHATFASLKPENVDLVIEAWIDRTTELSRLADVEQVFCFENRGQEIGVTLDHPHGQIYAYPFVTPRTRRMLDSARAYHRRTGRNLFEDRVASERADGRRVVLTSEFWTAFVPHAARWPYEVHLYPNRRVPDLAALSVDERTDLAGVYLDLLDRFDRLFDQPAPYISAWHQAPTREGRGEFALHLELFTVRRTQDKLKYLAGSESGMDAFANDVAPEAAAQLLRDLEGPT